MHWSKCVWHYLSSVYLEIAFEASACNGTIASYSLFIKPNHTINFPWFCWVLYYYHYNMHICMWFGHPAPCIHTTTRPRNCLHFGFLHFPFCTQTDSLLFVCISTFTSTSTGQTEYTTTFELFGTKYVCYKLFRPL